MARLRTFIAVDISSELRRRAAATIDALSNCTASFRWVPVGNIHLTVKFLGDVDEADIYQVCRASSEASRDSAPFQVQCQGLGAFPTIERPRTVWLGVKDADQQLEVFYENVEQALFALGFPKETRRFHPHLTLGRLRHGRSNVASLVERLQQSTDLDVGVIDVRELLIYSSELTGDGPTYTVLGRAPLEA